MENTRYQWFEGELRKIALLGSTAGLLAWDQETCMPRDAAEIRAQQSGILSGMIHEMKTAKALQDCVEELLGDQTLDVYQSVNVKEFNRSLQKSLKLSKAFVEELTMVVSSAYPAWHEAKLKDQFEIFAPHLEKIVALKREEAKLSGYIHHPYDALMDDFEPGLTVIEMDSLFDQLQKDFIPYVKNIMNKPQPDDQCFRQRFDVNLQKQLGHEILTSIGYRFSSGRMDLSEHPFCIGIHPTDVRVTYRLNPNDLSEMIWGLIHEGGHALYEQGLNSQYWGTPMGSTVSLAIHESQSRFWENNIARSEAFWKFWYPKLQASFPNELGEVAFKTFYHGMNRVSPSLIRIQADELTYHLHILIRYQIEKAIIEGSLSVNEIPEKWGSLYKTHLGVDVPNNAMGVLQDVHWSHGGFGYFPTYSMGSFYAAQFYQTLTKSFPVDEWIEQGNFAPIKQWLNENIHSQGMMLQADALCKKITGESLNFAYFMQYMHNKFDKIFA